MNDDSRNGAAVMFKLSDRSAAFTFVALIFDDANRTRAMVISWRDTNLLCARDLSQKNVYEAFARAFLSLAFLRPFNFAGHLVVQVCARLVLCIKGEWPNHTLFLFWSCNDNHERYVDVCISALNELLMFSNSWYTFLIRFFDLNLYDRARVIIRLCVLLQTVSYDANY